MSDVRVVIQRGLITEGKLDGKQWWWKIIWITFQFCTEFVKIIVELVG